MNPYATQIEALTDAYDTATVTYEDGTMGGGCSAILIAFRDGSEIALGSADGELDGQAVCEWQASVMDPDGSGSIGQPDRTVMGAVRSAMDAAGWCRMHEPGDPDCDCVAVVR